MASQPPVVNLLVPTADSTANLNIKEAIGNKTDAKQTTVGTTRSSMAYLKGTLSLVRSTTRETGVNTQTTLDGTNYELVASAAAEIHAIVLSGNATFSGAGDYTVNLRTGGAGAEVTVASARVGLGAAGRVQFVIISQEQFDAGTRLSWNHSGSGATSMTVGYTVTEA